SQLFAYLRRQQLLLVLDNFEHLLEGTSLVAEMLDSASSLTILVTSREPLNLEQEWVRHIAGMHIPNNQDDGIGEYSGVQLFVERARRVRGDFALTAEQAQVIRILRLVQGMPLGIELAVVWLKTLTCTQIADEIQCNLDFLVTPLRNTPERHQSI